MWLYRLLLVMLSPFILKRLFGYRKRYSNYRLEEALGRWPETRADFWLHCASVGEVLAAKALIEQWLAAYPHKTMLVTTVTPTGASQLSRLFPDRVQHRYLPIDLSFCVKRAFKHIHCSELAIVETELWPNLLRIAKQKAMRVQIINARLSERSAKRYQTYSFFSRALMALPTRFLAHSQVDAERFRALGANEVKVVGNIKFDLQVLDDPVVEDWRAGLVESGALVWVAASTHEGEDEQVLQAHQSLLKVNQQAKLIIVPRHPERFDQVFELARKTGLRVARRSNIPYEKWVEFDVLLGDSMGEMMRYYGISDVAFVGGSLIQRGGHNPIEPAILSKPILVGPYTFNFADITESLVEDGGAYRCADANELSSKLVELVNPDKRLSIGVNALANAQRNQGALKRVLQYLDFS